MPSDMRPELSYSPGYRIGGAMQDTDVVHAVAVYMFVAYGRLAHPGQAVDAIDYKNETVSSYVR